MTAIVDIYNMAVMEVGHSTAITDPNENTNAANLCRTFYPMCRDMVLESINWKFATKRVTLSLLPGKQTNWEYAYAYPADGLFIQAIVRPGMRKPPKEHEVPFEIGNMDGARVILTDMPQAEAIYTVRVENPNLFTQLFTSALVYQLASKVAAPLTGKAEMAANARAGYQLMLGHAAAANLNEAADGPDPDCEFVAIRGTGGSYA